MEKRLILAVILSSIILIIWSATLPKNPSRQIVEQVQPKVPVLVGELKPESPQDLFQLVRDKYEITFIESEAAIKEIVFKAYKSYQLPLLHGFRLLDKNLVFKKEQVSRNQAVFKYQDENKLIIKRFLFHNSNYNIELEIEVQNLSSQTQPLNLPLSIGVLDFSINPQEARFRDITVALADKTIRLNGRKDLLLEQAKFVAVRDRYFCNIVEPGQDRFSLLIKKINPAVAEISLVSSEIILEPGKTWRQKFRIYLGPQDLRIIKTINPGWAQVVHFGFFDLISQFLLQSLEFFYRILHNWGWAIICLSIAIYLILFPLTLKQMRSMKEIQALQPQIEELKKIYPDNPQKLHRETLELYRKHKVNPLGGCLPLLLQMPIFFALYQVLIRSIVLKGANFFWIKDLSEPDRLFILPKILPIIGNEFNLLPILMTIIIFWQQRISQATTSSEYADQQKIMLLMMPLLFGLIFYHLPAGLVLYWLMNSLITLVYQFRLSRVK